jgi:hypothetical protein
VAPADKGVAGVAERGHFTCFGPVFVAFQLQLALGGHVWLVGRRRG